jgi:predicted transcriptional regulator
VSVSLIDPKQVRRVRVSLGITQSALAKTAGISQSLVAKIEAGQVDPSFSTIKSIADALRQQIKTGAKKASDIMSKPVVSVQASTTVSDCIGLMRRRGISQLPVFSGTQLVGSISEGHIVSLLSVGADPKASLSRPVSKFLEPSYPIVDAGTPVDALFSLFNFFQAVLVMSGERLAGIITKIDMLSAEVR